MYRTHGAFHQQRLSSCKTSKDLFQNMQFLFLIDYPTCGTAKNSASIMEDPPSAEFHSESEKRIPTPMLCRAFFSSLATSPSAMVLISGSKSATRCAISKVVINESTSERISITADLASASSLP